MLLVTHFLIVLYERGRERTSEWMYVCCFYFFFESKCALFCAKIIIIDEESAVAAHQAIFRTVEKENKLTTAFNTNRDRSRSRSTPFFRFLSFLLLVSSKILSSFTFYSQFSVFIKKQLEKFIHNHWKLKLFLLMLFLSFVVLRSPFHRCLCCCWWWWQCRYC